MQARFVAPSVRDRVAMARIVVPGALGLQSVMVLFGVITWFAGYGVDTNRVRRWPYFRARAARSAPVRTGPCEGSAEETAR